MGKLKEKSNLNYSAAKVLIDQTLFAPSVHCSYYSCFQLMKYAIKDFEGISYKELGNRIGANKINTHVYVIKFISEIIKDNSNLVEYNAFNRKIKDLKQFREQSDYDNVDIDVTKGQQAYSIATEIRNKLKDYFHV